MSNLKEYQKQWQKNHREQNRKYLKQWRKDNPERVREHHKQYRENNPEKVRKYKRQYCAIRYKTNPKFNLNSKMTALIRHSLKGNKKGRNWENLVGYTCEDLIKHLEKTMPENYIWQDFLDGKLHVDHIIPIIVFEFENPEDKEFKQCWSLYNLRLLPSKENIFKNDRIDNPILLRLILSEVI